MSGNWKNELILPNSTSSDITVYQHRQKCFKIGWDINRNIFLLKGKC